MQYPHTPHPSSNLIFHTALHSTPWLNANELDQVSGFSLSKVTCPPMHVQKSSQKLKYGKCHLPTSPTDGLTSTSTSTLTLTQSASNLPF